MTSLLGPCFAVAVLALLSLAAAGNVCENFKLEVTKFKSCDETQPNVFRPETGSMTMLPDCTIEFLGTVSLDAFKTAQLNYSANVQHFDELEKKIPTLLTFVEKIHGESAEQVKTFVREFQKHMNGSYDGCLLLSWIPADVKKVVDRLGFPSSCPMVKTNLAGANMPKLTELKEFAEKSDMNAKIVQGILGIVNKLGLMSARVNIVHDTGVTCLDAAARLTNSKLEARRARFEKVKKGIKDRLRKRLSTTTTTAAAGAPPAPPPPMPASEPAVAAPPVAAPPAAP